LEKQNLLQSLFKVALRVYQLLNKTMQKLSAKISKMGPTASM